MNATLLRCSLIAALGGLLFGFDTAVISGTTEHLKEVFDLGGFWLGFTVSSALIGTIMGAMFASIPADWLGRRTTLVWIAFLYFVSAVGSALAWDWPSFLLFRWLGGLGVGASSVVAPMYIAEISPPQFRGRLVAITQFNIVFGILAAYMSNYGVALADLGQDEWRVMFGIEALPAAVFFALMFLNPRSPRWLVARGRSAEAAAVLEKVGAADVRKELREIEESLAAMGARAVESVFQRKYRRPVLLAVAISTFNQLSGINALMYYAPHIFRMAGAETDASLAQAVVVGCTNLVFTMTAMLVIDKIGRRKIMVVGSIGYIVSLAATAAAFYTYGTDFTPFGGAVVLTSLMVFIASHAFGQGSVIWVYLSEIFPNAVRAQGQALGSFTHWVFAALISWTFPMIAEVSGGHTFAFYSSMMVLQLVWVLKVMPETKGVPLEELQKRMTAD
ncbi:MAG: sugar porter family MFS transporter [Bryobacterales bacterium]|nr:sugar porter family MFS transporter [Bryobacterales bacterium]MDE0629506.1 sugar porter family MFS transporter [Bryobacterales bacterium]